MILNNSKNRRSHIETIRISRYFGTYNAFLRLSVYTACFVFYSLSAYAQVKISAYLDSTHIVVGGVTHLNVTIQVPENTEISTPKLRDSSAIELISEVKTVKMPHNGGQLITQVWSLTALDSGTWTLPALPFGYKLVTGATDTAYSPELQLTAVPAKLDSLTLRPIATIISEPLTWRDALPYFIGTLCLLFAIYAVYWYYNRKKTRQIAAQAVSQTITPPHIVAFAKLKKLEQRLKKQLEKQSEKQLAQQEQWQEQETKQYYVELSYIIREYLEKRYNLPVLEQTTDEFLPLLQQKANIEPAIFAALRNELITADLIKFAKADATYQQNEKALKFAFLLVETTKNDPLNKPTTEHDAATI
jgi:hypothetical protein